MYIILISRPDRMGANLSWYIMQIIYAHYHKMFIHVPELAFGNSIFMQTIRTFADAYNLELGETLGSHDHLSYFNFIQTSEQDWPGNAMIVSNAIQCDLVSYFKTHLHARFRAILDTHIIDKFVFSENPNKTIALHLRLDDVVARFDYDGIHSAEYYRDRLNADTIRIDLENEQAFFQNRGITIKGCGRHFNPYDCQAPIAEERIQTIIDQATEKYPDHKVVIVASPLGEINLPYPTIRSDDLDKDLAFLCQADVVICSRSLYCFSSVYLGNAREVFIPMWGHVAGTGLMSKYDHANLTYFF